LDGYSWGAAPAAGVIAGATSVSAFSALLKWGRLDRQRSSANIESQYDVDTAQAAQDLELENYLQDRLSGQIKRFLYSESSKDSSFLLQMP
jgi:hypothetical protein